MIVIPWHEQMRGSRFKKEKCDGQVYSRVVARCTGVCARYHLSDHELGRPGIQMENLVGFTRYLRQRF